MRKLTIRRINLKRKPIKKIQFKKVVIKKEELRKGIYILPSIFTCGNMSFGILSIFASIEGYFIPAAWFLIGALTCDIIDGMIARMTKTITAFGMQLDSLSDLVSFGVAPAVLMYMLVLNTMDKIGIAIAVLFVLCTGLRLARFNVLAQRGQIHKHFVGLPTPASAGVIISFVLSYKLLAPEEYTLNFNTIPALMELMPTFFDIMPIVMIVLSLLMVSNVPYLAFKEVKLSKVKTINVVVFVIVVIILIVVYPQNIIFIIFSIYAISGLIFFVLQIFLKRKQGRKSAINVEAEDEEV